jgi:hypothetical protein
MEGSDSNYWYPRWYPGRGLLRRQYVQPLEFTGGASRDRTDDLFHAMEALSQLSYGPVRKTLNLKGIIPADAKEVAASRRSEGRENTRNRPLGK